VAAPSEAVARVCTSRGSPQTTVGDGGLQRVGDGGVQGVAHAGLLGKAGGYRALRMPLAGQGRQTGAKRAKSACACAAAIAPRYAPLPVRRGRWRWR
jgi:hypothetical protein